MFKRALLTSLLLIGFYTLLFPQEKDYKKFIGVWKGVISHGGQEMNVEFNIEEKNDKPVGIAINHDQGDDTLPMDGLTIKGNKISFSLSEIDGNYSGTYNEEKKIIEGVITIGEQSETLDMKKFEKEKKEDPKTEKPAEKK